MQLDAPGGLSDDEIAATTIHAVLERVLDALDEDNAAGTDESVDAVLEQVRSLLPARAASITVRRVTGKPFRTTASTGAEASALDEAQYRFGKGPCLEAASGQGTVLTRDVADDPRWPALTAVAKAGLPARSVVSVPLPGTSVATAGASLNLYGVELSDVPDAAVRARAQTAAGLTAAVLTALAARATIANLTIALQSSRQIGAAIGVLMTRRQVTYDAAFELLRVTSQQSHRKLYNVAEDVLLTGELPRT